MVLVANWALALHREIAANFSAQVNLTSPVELIAPNCVDVGREGDCPSPPRKLRVCPQQNLPSRRFSNRPDD